MQLFERRQYRFQQMQRIFFHYQYKINHFYFWKLKIAFSFFVVSCIMSQFSWAANGKCFIFCSVLWFNAFNETAING